MEKPFEVYGRAIIVAGVVPALIFLFLALFLLGLVGAISLQQFVYLSGQERLALFTLILGAAGVLGVLLIALNRPIILFYEGAFPIQQRWLLRHARQRNLRQHNELYGPLHARRQMHQVAVTSLAEADGRDRLEQQRRIDSAALEIEKIHSNLEGKLQDRPLPVEPSFVTATALGNAYAVMEEYPYERYGMDSMVFWSRLLAVIPSDYRTNIGEQKTTCDFLVNLALLFSVLTIGVIAILISYLFARQALAPGVILIMIALLALLPLAAYASYRAAVTETYILGKLINGAFDLYRYDLLHQFRIELPNNLEEEQQTWKRLAAFIRRGEPFYYPGPGHPERQITSMIYEDASPDRKSVEES